MSKDHYFAKFEEGCFYHIYNRANSNRDKLFFDVKNYYYFLQKFNHYLSSYLSVWAYCLIPNHFHFLVNVKINSIEPWKSQDINHIVNDKFRRLFIAYSQAINYQENRRGSLFQKRFKRICIDSEDYLSALIHYIHYNPLIHGLTANIFNWKFNSYFSHISNRETKLARTDVLEWFGGKRAYIKFHQSNYDYNKISNYIIEG